MNILAAIPVKKSLNEALRARMAIQADALAKQNGITVAIHENEPVVEAIRGRADYVLKRSMNLCHARNSLLDIYLKPEHEFVMWIDADIVDYPEDLALRLLREVSDGVIAPMILIEGTDRYYDTYTHIDLKGTPARAATPYFDVDDDLIPMSCVGGCYLMPAEVHRAMHYTPSGGPGMEHLTLMRVAKKMGFDIFVTRRVKVYHADLPKWGEIYH